MVRLLRAEHDPEHRPQKTALSYKGALTLQGQPCLKSTASRLRVGEIPRRLELRKLG